MWYVVKRLALGVLLIVLASAVLLVSDWRHRRPLGGVSAGAGAQAVRPIALFQLATNPFIDDTAVGVLDGLKSKGFESGRNIKVTRFNAEGDWATANSIAKSPFPSPEPNIPPSYPHTPAPVHFQSPGRQSAEATSNGDPRRRGIIPRPWYLQEIPADGEGRSQFHSNASFPNLLCAFASLRDTRTVPRQDAKMQGALRGSVPFLEVLSWRLYHAIQKETL